MGAKEFGQLVADRMDELGFSQNKVARRFGELPDGRGLDSSQVRVIKEGGRRLDHALVERLIHVLGLDADPATELRAWEAAGLWPPSATVDDISDFRAARLMAATRAAKVHEGARSAAPPFTSQQGRSNKATLFASARQRVAA